MKIKVDMHVHPSLPKSEKKAIAKAKKWWQALKKAGITCIISSEHTYHDCKRNYEIMKKTAPKGFVIFPGAEMVSKENIDIVIFYKDDSVYKEEKILKPFEIKIDRLIDYLNKRKYAYYIPHPFTLGTTSIFKLGEKKAIKIMKKAKSIEAHNTSFKPVAKLSKKIGISKIMGKKYERALLVENVPKKYLKNVKFISGGSDAHRPACIGSCMIIDTKSKKPSDIYNALTSNKKDMFFSSNKLFMPGIIISAKETLKDWIVKKKYSIFR